MRTTVDLSEELMSDLMALSKTGKKKDAVRMALEDFISRRKLEKLLASQGKIEISNVTAELERMELDESKGAD
jgi:Arc/MetJ family transcription regulator